MPRSEALPAPADCAPVRHRRPPARSTAPPSRPRAAAPHRWQLHEAATPYRADDALERAHEVAVELAAARARVVLPLARVAQALVRTRACHQFGYARLEDFCRERHGRSSRWVRDMAVLQGHFERLPPLAAAVAGDDGSPPLHVSAALAIGAVATPDSVGRWIARGRDVTLALLKRELRDGARRLSDRTAGPQDEPVSPSIQAGEPAGTRAGPAGTRAGPSGSEERTTREDQTAGMDGGPAPPEGQTPGSPGEAAAQESGPADPRSGSADGGAGRLRVENEALEADPVVVRLVVAPAVRAAFDETLDLYRAVTGSDGSVASFIEHMIAESLAAPGPGPSTDASIEGTVEPLVKGPDREAVEQACEQASGGWGGLARTGQASQALKDAGWSLHRLGRLMKVAGAGDARRLDKHLGELLHLQNTLELRLGEVLHQMGGMKAWGRLGFDNAGHYAERILAVCRTVAEDRMWAAAAIRPYALVRQAYERGELSWEATRWVLRLLKGADPADLQLQRRWIVRGRESTVKRLRDEARARRREAVLDGGGGKHETGGKLDAGRHEAGAHESGEHEPGSHEAGAHESGEHESGQHEVGGHEPGEHGESGEHEAGEHEPGSHEPMTDEAWHASLRREPGIAVERMARFGEVLVRQAARQTPARSMKEVPMRLRLPAWLARAFMKAMRGRWDTLVRQVEAVPKDKPWPDPASPASVRVTRIFSTRGWRPPLWVGLLGLMEDCVHEWEPKEANVGDKSRQELFARAGYRCSAPGCTGRDCLEDHHVKFRSAGGGHGLTNRASVCVFHHQKAIHAGLALSWGTAPLQITWLLGRGPLAERFRNERRTRE